MSRPTFSPGWEPSRRGVTFGSDDGPAQIVRLDGGYVAPPIPPDYQGPPRGLSKVQVVEPTEGYWNQDGVFGFRYQGQVPPLAGSVIPLTENLRLPGPPRLWWINWFRYSRNISDEGSLPYGTWDLRGRVTYGVGGATNVVECDVAAGIQMAMVASTIRVDLIAYAPELDGLDELVYDPGQVGVVAGAMFGDGAAGGSLPVTWSSLLYTVPAAGLVAVVPVPNFARSVCLHTTETDPTNLAGVLISFTSPGSPIKVIDAGELYRELSLEKGIAVPAGTNQVTLTAPAGTAGERFQLQFFLAL